MGLSFERLVKGDDVSATNPASSALAAKAVDIPEYHAIRIQNYIYVEYSTGEKEFYNIANDPNELHNLAATADPALLQRFSQRLAMLKTCQMSACQSAEDMAFSV